MTVKTSASTPNYPMILHPKPLRAHGNRYPGPAQRGFYAVIVAENKTELAKYSYDVYGYAEEDDTLAPQNLNADIAKRTGGIDRLAEVHVKSYTPKAGYSPFLRVKVGTKVVLFVPLYDGLDFVSTVVSPSPFDRIPKTWFVASGTGSLPAEAYTRLIDASSTVSSPDSITGAAGDWQVTWEDTDFSVGFEVQLEVGTNAVDHTVTNLRITDRP